MRHPAGQQKYYGKLAKVGLVWGAVREGTNFFLQLPAAIILARLLTPAETGVAAAAYFFMQLTTRLTQFGFGVALVRAKEITAEHVASVFVMNLGLGTAAWAALTVSSHAMGTFFRSPETAAVLRVVAFGFFTLAFASVPTALLSRDMRYREGATTDWLSTATISILSVLLAWRGYSYWSLVYANMAGDVVRAVARSIIVRWVPSFKCSRQAIRDMFSFGAGIYAKNLLDYAVQNLDNLVVGRVIGITALGFYDKAYSTMSKLTAKINLSGPSVSFRIFALIEEDRDRFRRAYRKVVLSVTLIAYPILTGLILVGPELINVMYGARWMPAVVPFQILCVAAMFRTLNTYASSATQAKGQIWSEVHRQALFTIVLVAGVATGSSWGISGAAAGVLISTAFMTVLLQALVRRLSGLSWGDMLGPQVPAFVCTAGLIVIVLLTKRGLNAVLGNPPAPIVLILCVVISAVYYGGFLLFARFSDVREVVHETASDLAPGVAKRLRWMQPQTKEIPALPAR